MSHFPGYCHLFVDRRAAHDGDAGAPVFVDVEAIDFDVGGDAVGECLESRVNAQSGSDEVDEWWLVTDSARAE